MYKECKPILPQRLKEMRAKYGFNQEYVAEKVGLRRTNIANYESGRNVPPVDKLHALADIYHTSIDYLVGRTDNIEPFHASSDLMPIGNIKHLRLMHNGVELTDVEKDAIINMIENMLAFKLDKKG